MERGPNRRALRQRHASIKRGSIRPLLHLVVSAPPLVPLLFVPTPLGLHLLLPHLASRNAVTLLVLRGAQRTGTSADWKVQMHGGDNHRMIPLHHDGEVYRMLWLHGAAVLAVACCG